MSRGFENIVGVDLGGGRGKTTAVAVLHRDGDAARVIDLAPRRGARPLYDAALVELVGGIAAPLLCIGAPLSLPPCLRCTLACPGATACEVPAVAAMRELLQSGPPPVETRDTRRGKPTLTPYTQRATEVHLSLARGMAVREGLGQGTGPLAARAAYLRRALPGFTLDRNLIEVYPRATLTALGFERPYKKHHQEQETRAEILESFASRLSFAPGIWREVCVQSDHLFEAVICAFTGLLWACEDWQRPLEGLALEDGWIWVPPPRREQEAGVEPPALAYARSAGSS